MTSEEIPPKGIWTEDMGEISGFGGEYEEACRTMVRAGLQWLDRHNLDEDPLFTKYTGVYGMVNPENGIAEAMLNRMVDALDEDPTGAMTQATVNTVMFIRRQGWDTYVREMRSAEAQRDD